MKFLCLLLGIGAPLAAQTCTFTLTPNARTVPATPDTVGTINVTASASTCARSAVSDSTDWLTVSFGTPGTGNGTVGYRVEINRTANQRMGNITIGNARFTVTQSGADCGFDLNPVTARVMRTSGRGTLRVTSRCDWTAVSSAPWLTIVSGAMGSGDGTIEHAYAENTTTESRAATITVGPRTFTLTQEGAPCTVTLNPQSADFTGDGGTGTLGVLSTCAWRAVPNQTWVTITGSDSGTGNGIVSYRVAANTGAQGRQAAITVGNQAFTVRQSATELPVITAITSAASFARDIAAPGSVVAVFGNRLGPSQLTTAQLTDDRQFLTTTLAGTRVLFDNTPAPMIYTFESVVAAAAPYNVEGKRSVRVVVEFGGRRSLEYTLSIGAVAPAVFTANASGIGAAAALNQDLSLNTPSNPIERGSTLVIYATGEGVTNPPGVDGKLNGAEPPQPLAPVIVSIGGAVAQIAYKGGVPGVTPGLLQINAIVPPAAPTGSAVPLIVNIGGVISQPGVTVSVR